MCLFIVLFYHKFTIFSFWNMFQWETIHACDTIWNLGDANTICCSTGCIRPRERLGSRTFPTLTCYLLLLFFILVVLVLELGALSLLIRCPISWATLPALFQAGYFQDRVTRTICLDHPPTMFIPNPVSSIARIIGLTHTGILLWFLRQDLSCNPG
jgi:hypothetical protein